MLTYGAIDIAGSKFDKAIEAMVVDNKIDEDILLNFQIQAYSNTGKVRSDWNQWACDMFKESGAQEIGISKTISYEREALVYSKSFMRCMPLIGYNDDRVVFTHADCISAIDEFFRDMNGTGFTYAFYRPKPGCNAYIQHYENTLNNYPQISGYCIYLDTTATINCAYNDVTREAFVWAPS